MTDMVDYRRIGRIARLKIANPPVNALSQAVRAALADCLAQAEADTDVEAVLLVGAGSTFIAGADIREFGKPPAAPHLSDLCARMETSSLLIVASLHGVSLGGGLEVALCAHYRIAQPDARIGLPEVHLGLIPGAGGTQRLPRLTGARAAIDLITTGRHVAAKEALSLRIIDRITEGDPEEIGLEYTRELLAQKAPRRPICDMAPPAPLDWKAARTEVAHRARGQLAPVEAVRAVEASTAVPFAEGLAAERRLFENLMQTDQRQGMIHAFFAERAASTLPELKDVKPRPVQTVGVVGGGTMGSGIATAVLLAGLDVILIETSDSAAKAAHGAIVRNLDGAVSRGKISTDDRDRILNKAFRTASQMSTLSMADLVIEAVFEDMEVKQAVFAELDCCCRSDAILASNTSYLDLQAIAQNTDHPERVIGLHFFSPAHVMKLLEIVVPDAAALDVVATGFALGKRLRKISVRAGVGEGFIGNRILNAYRTVADHLVLDGATPFEIDAAMVAFGFPMGPFAVSDLAGLDIGWSMRKRRAATRDPRERIGKYADWLCEDGHFGRKTGAGFYRYTAGKSPAPNDAVLHLIDADRATRGITPRQFEAEEITSRILAAMVNEGANVVADGVARRPLDVDVVMVAGYGFPRHWGGPLKWADLQGLQEIVTQTAQFAKDDAFFWQPAPLLVDLAAQDKDFSSLNDQS